MADLLENGLSWDPVRISKCEKDFKATEMVMVAMENKFIEN